MPVSPEIWAFNSPINNTPVNPEVTYQTAFGDPYSGRVASFDDIRQLYTVPRPSRVSLTNELGGSDYEKILNTIKKRTEDARKKSISEAQALAVRRGIGGSSTEQYGVAQAGNTAEEAGLSAETDVLLQKIAREQALRDLNARLDQDNINALGQLTSDEIASLRNNDFSRQYLQLQQQLGTAGLDIARSNIDMSRELARDEARNNLISAGLQGVLPFVMPRLFGGSTPGVPGGGGGAGSVNPGMLSGLLSFGKNSTLTGVANPGAGSPASSLFPGGVGNVGTGVNRLGGFGGGAGSILMGAGAGYLGTSLGKSLIGAKTRGERDAANIGGAVGTGIGMFFGGPIGAGIGGLVGAGAGKLTRDVGKSISKTVSKVFPF